MITYAQVKQYAKEVRDKEETIWNDVEENLYQKYIKEGYFMWWARQKAQKDVLELRSQPRNAHPMPSGLTSEEVKNMGSLD